MAYTPMPNSLEQSLQSIVREVADPNAAASNTVFLIREALGQAYAGSGTLIELEPDLIPPPGDETNLDQRGGGKTLSREVVSAGIGAVRIPRSKRAAVWASGGRWAGSFASSRETNSSRESGMSGALSLARGGASVKWRCMRTTCDMPENGGRPVSI